MTRLNQILATEPGLRARAHEVKTALHRETQRKEAVSGFTKSYSAKNAEDSTYPDEKQVVQLTATRAFAQLQRVLEPLFNATLTKDGANTDTAAEVHVNGVRILPAVPPTYLLFLQKQLTDLRTFVDKMVELEPGIEWTSEPASGLFKSPSTRAERTRKENVPVVLHPPTVEHPAQTQLVTKDVVVGWWDTVKLSGAIEPTRKQAIIEKIDGLLAGVQFALEEANQIEIDEETSAGRAILDFIFA